MVPISSSDHRLPMSKTRLKPLILRDYLLDDLSSCSSNGFKSFPRLLDSKIKRSELFHYNRRITCGLALSHAVHKVSTALLTAVKLWPFPSSVKSPSGKRKNGPFLRSFSRRNFWKISKPSRHELNVDGDNERKMEIQRWKSFADFLQESQDQPSDQISCVFPTFSVSGEATLSNGVGDSSSLSSENSEVTQSSSSVMKSGDCVGSHSHVSDGSTVNDNRQQECVNEEGEQLSPISILEFPFEDDAITPPSYQNEMAEKKHMRKNRRFESLVRLEPVDLKKRIEKYVERQDYDSHVRETEEAQSENRADRLLALVKFRMIEEPNQLLESHVVDNVLIDFFKENGNNETRVYEDKLVKIAEKWVMSKEEEEYNICMSWEVKERREIYVKEMKWGCMINGEEIEYVVEELENGFVISLIDELIFDLSL